MTFREYFKRKPAGGGWVTYGPVSIYRPANPFLYGMARLLYPTGRELGYRVQPVQRLGVMEALANDWARVEGDMWRAVGRAADETGTTPTAALQRAVALQSGD